MRCPPPRLAPWGIDPLADCRDPGSAVGARRRPHEGQESNLGRGTAPTAAPPRAIRCGKGAVPLPSRGCAGAHAGHGLGQWDRRGALSAYYTRRSRPRREGGIKPGIRMAGRVPGHRAVGSPSFAAPSFQALLRLLRLPRLWRPAASPERAPGVTTIHLTGGTVLRRLLTASARAAVPGRLDSQLERCCSDGRWGRGAAEA